jgi:hypothetical protein
VSTDEKKYFGLIHAEILKIFMKVEVNKQNSEAGITE